MMRGGRSKEAGTLDGAAGEPIGYLRVGRTVRWPFRAFGLPCSVSAPCWVGGDAWRAQVRIQGSWVR